MLDKIKFYIKGRKLLRVSLKLRLNVLSKKQDCAIVAFKSDAQPLALFPESPNFATDYFLHRKILPP